MRFSLGARKSNHPMMLCRAAKVLFSDNAYVSWFYGQLDATTAATRLASPYMPAAVPPVRVTRSIGHTWAVIDYYNDLSEFLRNLIILPGEEVLGPF